MKYFGQFALLAGLSALLIGCGGGGSDYYGGGSRASRFQGTYSGNWQNINDNTAYGADDYTVDYYGAESGTLYDSRGAILGAVAGTISDNGSFNGSYTPVNGNTLSATGTAFFRNSDQVLQLDVTDNRGTFQLDLTSRYVGRSPSPATHVKSTKTAAESLGAQVQTHRFKTK